MAVKSWLICETTLEDDAVEEDSDFVRHSGRNVTEAVQEVLAAIGCTKIGEPWEEGEQGWQFLFQCEKRRFWCQVSRPGSDCLIHFGRNYLFEGLFRSGPSPHETLVRRIAHALGRDSRFSNLRWLTLEEMRNADLE